MYRVEPEHSTYILRSLRSFPTPPIQVLKELLTFLKRCTSSLSSNFHVAYIRLPETVLKSGLSGLQEQRSVLGNGLQLLGKKYLFWNFIKFSGGTFTIRLDLCCKFCILSSNGSSVHHDAPLQICIIPCYNTNYLFMSLVFTSKTHKQHIENIAEPGMVAASTSLYYISLSLGFGNRSYGWATN